VNAELFPSTVDFMSLCVSKSSVLVCNTEVQHKVNMRLVIIAL